MGWSLGFDARWNRYVGYGVPAYCDHPGCDEEIDRGLAYVCADEQPKGGDHGCGLYFCEKHRYCRGNHHRCSRCTNYRPPFTPKPEHPRWLRHLLTDETWAKWRAEHPDDVAAMTQQLSSQPVEAPETP